MQKIISMVNHKGGVGKTTSAVNIAAALCELGEKVLLIDLDPQGSASMSLGVTDDGKNFLQTLQRTTALPAMATVINGLDLVASGPDLAEAGHRFTPSIGTELLPRCLKQTKGDWDWVIIDCPPNMGVLTLSALKASHHLVIPVETNFLALNGLRQMTATLASLRTQIGALQIEAVIPCRAHPRRRVHAEIMQKLEELFPDKVTPAIRENVSLAEAPGHGLPVLSYAPKSHGAEDYRQVARWLSARMSWSR